MGKQNLGWLVCNPNNKSKKEAHKINHSQKHHVHVQTYGPHDQSQFMLDPLISQLIIKLLHRCVLQQLITFTVINMQACKSDTFHNVTIDVNNWWGSTLVWNSLKQINDSNKQDSILLHQNNNWPHVGIGPTHCPFLQVRTGSMESSTISKPLMQSNLTLCPSWSILFMYAPLYGSKWYMALGTAGGTGHVTSGKKQNPLTYYNYWLPSL